MLRHNLKVHHSQIITLVLMFIAFCYVVITYNAPYVGDDYFHPMSFDKISDKHHVFAYPIYVVAKWLYSNARMADNFNPLIYNIIDNDLVFAFINAIITMCIFGIVVKLIYPKNQNVYVAVMAIIALTFGLPWGALLIHACMINYVWSAAFSLIAVYFLIHKQKFLSKLNGLKLVMACILLLSAAMMHEAAGFPLGIGITCWLWLTQRMGQQPIFFNKSIKWCFYSFLIGSVLVVSSPGSYLRLLHPLPQENTLSELIVVNAPSIIMVTIIMLLLAFRNSRIKQFILSHNIVLIIASAVSMCFLLITMAATRSAFFASCFAFIVIFRLLAFYGIGNKLKMLVNGSSINSLKRIFMFLGVSLIIVHYSMFAYYQYIVGNEHRDAIRQYVNSVDGKVRIKYTHKDEIPAIIMSKTNGVEILNNEWNILCLQEYFGKPRIELIEEESQEKSANS